MQEGEKPSLVPILGSRRWAGSEGKGQGRGLMRGGAGGEKSAAPGSDNRRGDIHRGRTHQGIPALVVLPPT